MTIKSVHNPSTKNETKSISTFPSINYSHITQLFIVCLLGGYQKCSPGQYFYQPRDPIDESCESCFIGSYCPGDNEVYQCPPETIAPKVGMSSCISCNGANVSSGATMCLLDDTPKDAQEIYPKYNRKTLNFTPKDRQTYLFIGEDTKYFNVLTHSLVIYTSSVTGQPNESNYQWKTSGTFPELIIPIESIVIPKNNSFVQISFTIINTPDNPFRQYPITGSIHFAFIEKEPKFETPTKKSNFLTHLKSFIHYRGQNNYTPMHAEEVHVAPKVSSGISVFSSVLLISIVVVIFVLIWKRNQVKDWIHGKPKSNE